MAGDITAQRWQRHGKDRYYLRAADGTQLGYYDALAGTLHLERPGLDGPCREALERAGVQLPPGETVPEQRSPVEPVGSEAVSFLGAEEDLAARRPGQAARERATAELASDRERSRVRTFIARTLDAKTDERAWRVGAAGEDTVGQRLERLTEHGWHVLHAVPVGNLGSDIDHVLIGPGGVFTVNTKTHLGKRISVTRHSIYVDGHSKPYLRNSRHEAQRAQKLLSAAHGGDVEVRPAIVILTGTYIPNVDYKSQPDDVLVLDRLDVPRRFRRARVRLAPDEVEQIFAVARLPATWSARNG